MRTLEYDGIVIGAGHNGMILEGYLAKAGLKVLAIEAQLEIGGGLDSHEDLAAPGHWHNVHSVFHRNVTELAWYRDLEVARFGGRYLAPEPGVAAILEDHRAVLWYSDLERTYQSFAKISQRDAETYREVRLRYGPVVEQIILPETYDAPVPTNEKRELLSRSAVGREYLKYCDRTPRDVIVDLFEDEVIRGVVAFLVVMRGFAIDGEGLGWFVPGMVAGGVNPRLARGSSHRLAHALHKMVVTNGGDLVESKEVRRILVEDGAAVGVELVDGTRIMARKFVASSLNPHDTFLRLIGREKLDPAFADRVAGFKFSAINPIFSINLALNDRPRYIAEEKEPEVAKSLMQCVGIDCLRDIIDLHTDCRAGRVPRKTFMNGTCASVHDPNQAPAGKHTAFMWELAPQELADGGPQRWDEIKAQHLEECLVRWRYYAPNLDEKNIITKSSYTPLDIERHNHNMRGGDWMVGEMNGTQTLDKRPLPELSQYRTPFKNLYLCGSSSHPGGNITGGPGYNAAKVVAQDLGIDLWWKPHDVRKLWAKLG